MSNNHDPYIDDKTGTLLNKFNVIDSKILDNLENDIIPGRIIALKKKGMIIDSVFKIQEILFTCLAQSLIGLVSSEQ